MIRYEEPKNWIYYDVGAIVRELTEAKTAILSLMNIPYQRDWIESLQQIQLKREVAGTSRIEGAEFTEKELEDALKDKETAEELFTRSQRQARAALAAYRWIATLPDDYPVNLDLILQIHRLIVTGADDDHCPPGELRTSDQNVTFGAPRHRGVEGGDECQQSLFALCEAVNREFRAHDPLVQALALHYHIGAMHPFLDGNGRTARALEAAMLRRAGLKDPLFIAMSNFYYDEKTAYLTSLSRVRERRHDLTEFLIFGLRGVAIQCRRLFNEIRTRVSKALFRNLMHDLFNRLENARKQALAKRQMEILKLLLDKDQLEFDELARALGGLYNSLGNPRKAFLRDITLLINLGAIKAEEMEKDRVEISIDLTWPTIMTEAEFLERMGQAPRSRIWPFLTGSE
jgi:Fic family protein